MENKLAPLHGVTRFHTMRAVRAQRIQLCLLATMCCGFFCGAAQTDQSEPQGEPWLCHTIDSASRGADGVKLSDVNQDGRLDIVTGWEEGGITRVYLQPPAEKVKDEWPAVTVGSTPSVEDAVFVDLDGDGAVDVVSSCEGRERAMYVHWSSRNTDALLDEASWKREVIPASNKTMQWMYAWPMNVDDRNGVDILAGGKGNGAEIGWFESAADPRDLASYQWHTISPAGWVMSLWKRDMDGDGDLDVVVSDRYGERRGCRWLENPGFDGELEAEWANHYMGAQDKEVLSMDMIDLDGDGMEDAVVATKDFKVLFLRRLDKSGTEWETKEFGADFQAGNTRAVRAADLDHDGKLDLAITTWISADKHGVFWMKSSSSLDEWDAFQISGTEKGIKYDRIELIDLDHDGDLDLLTCEEREGGGGMGVIWYENPAARKE